MEKNKKEDEKKMENKYIITIIAVIIIISAIMVVITNNNSQNRPNDELVVCIAAHGGEPESGFNPMTGWGKRDDPLIQSTLFKYDSNATLINDLATSYNISDDLKTYTVNIREGIKFTDESPLTAEDVVFTYNKAKESGETTNLESLDNAQKVNDTTIQFTLNRPDSTFINKLAHVGIVPSDSYNNITYGENPIGSGPYKLKQWDKGQQAILEVNDNYYGKKPYFTQLTILFPEEDTAFELVKSHQADVVQAPFTSLNQTVDGYKLINYTSPRAQGLSLPYLNNTGLTTDNGHAVGNNVTADKASREALNIGIDRTSIINSVYKGYGKVEYSGVDSQVYANNDSKVTDNNPQEAKNILEQAGWVDTNGDGIREKDGKNASFKLYYSSKDQSRQSLATVISEQAKPLGINIELVGTDWDTIYQNMYSEAALMQQSSDNPYRTIYQQYHSKENFTEDDYMNPNAYNSSEVDAILEEALSSTNQNESNNLWAKAAYTGNGGFGPKGDAPWLWVADYNYCYFVKDGINMGKEPIMGQDYLANICDWTRENTTA